MRFAGYIFTYRPLLEIKYHSIEFNPEKIEKQTKILNDYLKQDWIFQSQYQTESGIVVELVKEFTKPKKPNWFSFRKKRDLK